MAIDLSRENRQIPATVRWRDLRQHKQWARYKVGRLSACFKPVSHARNVLPEIGSMCVDFLVSKMSVASSGE